MGRGRPGHGRGLAGLPSYRLIRFHRAADGSWSYAGLIEPTGLPTGVLSTEVWRAVGSQGRFVVLMRDLTADGYTYRFLEFERAADGSWANLGSFHKTDPLPSDLVMSGRVFGYSIGGRSSLQRFMFRREPDGSWTASPAFDCPLLSALGDHWSFTEGRFAFSADNPFTVLYANSGIAWTVSRQPDGTWLSGAEFGAPFPDANERFGERLVVDGDRLFASIQSEKSSAPGGIQWPLGTVYEFDLSQMGLALQNSVEEVSLGDGGEIFLAMDFDAEISSALVVGSATGTSPGLPLVAGTLDLVLDAYTDLTLAGANQAPFYDTLAGEVVFKPLGPAETDGHAVISLPPGVNPALAGATLHHAALGFGPLPGFALLEITNTVSTLLVP